MTPWLTVSKRMYLFFFPIWLSFHHKFKQRIMKRMFKRGVSKISIIMLTKCFRGLWWCLQILKKWLAAFWMSKFQECGWVNHTQALNHLGAMWMTSFQDWNSCKWVHLNYHIWFHFIFIRMPNVTLLSSFSVHPRHKWPRLSIAYNVCNCYTELSKYEYGKQNLWKLL